jgi:hypothetical protein
MDLTFEIFRTGTHTDMSGRTRTYGEEDLDNLVRAYNEQPEGNRHDAPLVLGHPKTDSPAYGWVEKIRRVGDTLFCDARDVADELVDWIKQKRYSKRSMKTKGGLLYHIGFLGGTPPSVKGLADIQFSESDDGEVFEFADTWTWDAVASMFRRLREWFIANKDLETADTIVPEWDIQRIEEASRAPQVETSSSYSDPEPEKNVDPALAAEIERLRAEADQSRQRISALERERADLEIAAFCDSVEMRTRLTPALRPLAEELLRMCGGVTEYQFADGGSDARQFAERFLSALPVQVEFAEIAKPGNASTDIPANDDVIAQGRAIADAANRK